MCVIAISRAGYRQPTEKEFRAMWRHNPDGAGYMYARNNEVVIHKGFMKFSDFMFAISSEHFTKDDAVVYHFRISTQAGKTATMTHPFPLSSDPKHMEALDLVAPLGIAHNGVIRMTTDAKEKRFSDTALFIMEYLSRNLFRSLDDVKNPFLLDIIEEIGGWSKFAFMESDGNIITVGKFIDDKGILLSNENHKIIYTPKPGNFTTATYTKYYAPAGSTDDIYTWK